ncbi:tyrosine-type recombinase/integrase [Halomicrobium katesii]|uniref:tyrosine-type recombinase/integrase n=1 Tax=Halomicrobium katesii TaxID=437163 RepID=UPI000364773F|nr:phage integrase SAM-like domain-containing protein [Halomicrobium katesii]
MTDITIEEAIEAYLEERKSELSDSSIQNHRYQLKQFRLWARGAGGIDNLDDIDPLDLSRFRRYRSNDLNSNTMYNQLGVLRLLLRFTHRMGWVEEELPDSIVLPTRSGRSRDSSIDPDRITSIIDDLERYQYASLNHVILSLLWTCSLRIGALRSLDSDRDLHLDEQWIDMVHRPDTGTPLKNKGGSEREINLHGWVADVLRAWITDRRPDVTDASSRQPLVASSRGRMARSSIRERVYRLTACGSLGDGCECGSDPITDCSDVVSPHDVRRSSISAWLDDKVDPGLLASRVDSSQSTIEEHYDVRSESDKRELRRDAFDM